MSATIQIFDAEVSLATSDAPTYGGTIPVTLGPNWQPNDIRIWCNCAYYWSPVTSPPSWGWFGYGPSSWTKKAATVVNNSLGYGAVYWRRLTPGDEDYSVTLSTTTGSGNPVTPDTLFYWATATFTIRGVDPTSTPVMGDLEGLGAVSFTADSVNVPYAGVMVYWAEAFGQKPYNPPAPLHHILPGNSMGIPSGWSGVAATDKSGATYDPSENSPSTILIAKRFTGAGSTGSVVLPHGANRFIYTTGNYMFFKPAPDVAISTPAATETDTAAAATLSLSSQVDIVTPPATEVDVAETAYNPVHGYWTSDPLRLPGNPITASLLRYDAIVPDGASLVVATSINNGASWDPAPSGKPVPRLREGNTTTRTVLVRASATRTSDTGAKPKLRWLKLQVSDDTSTYEMVPIGRGVVDDAEVVATSGAAGGSGGGGGAGVTARGGGFSGGGTTLKVHAMDLAWAIRRKKWTMPYFVPLGITYGEAVRLLVRNRLPSQTEFDIASTPHIITESIVFGLDPGGGDPWDDISKLALHAGCQVFFDANGVCVFRPVPDPRLGEPVWVVDQDVHPVVTNAKKKTTSQKTFNHIVGRSEATSSKNPLVAEAYDDDPSSLTYIHGEYGEHTQTVSFPWCTTQEQLQAAVNASLYLSIGAAQTVTVTMPIMAALEPFDIVRANVPAARTNGKFRINAIEDSGPASAFGQYTLFRQTDTR